jgi:hypothetical protein
VNPRFLIDEHVDHAVQRQLRRLDSRIDVLAIGDAGAPAAGSPDPDLLLWIEEHGYILITEDRSTMPTHLAGHLAAGHHIPGVFWIRPDIGIGRIIEELYLIWSVSVADEYVDCALFIPL